MRLLDFCASRVRASASCHRANSSKSSECCSDKSNAQKEGSDASISTSGEGSASGLAPPLTSAAATPLPGLLVRCSRSRSMPSQAQQTRCNRARSRRAAARKAATSEKRAAASSLASPSEPGSRAISSRSRCKKDCTEDLASARHSSRNCCSTSRLLDSREPSAARPKQAESASLCRPSRLLHRRACKSWFFAMQILSGTLSSSVEEGCLHVFACAWLDTG
mmetsp:Transcript_37833/g.126579  ORF Transcript_37833/g.126579 Transcript_37833/m.126579 type:complete len:221 (+) Transcript_37833:176-838(+)